MILLPILAAALSGAPPASTDASAEVDGTRIAVTVKGSGEERQVELRLSDAASGEPLREAEPLGWLYPDDPAMSCKAVIAKASNGALGSPGINLNSMRIAAAFADGSLGMVDPQTSFAGTQLESAFELGSPARALAASIRGDRIAVVTEAGKLHLVDASGAMRAVATSSISADAAIGWDGSSLLVAGGSGLTRLAGLDGATINHRDWSLVGKPLLRIVEGQGLLIASESGPVGLATRASPDFVRLPGIAGVHDAAWLGKSAIWAIATSGSQLVMARPDGTSQSINALSGVTAVASDSEGRYLLAAIDGGANLALIDASDNRVLDVRPLPEKADRITVSRDFAYVHSGSSANVQLISFEVVGQQHRISSVDLPFGGVAGGGQAPFSRVAVLPGGAAVIGQDGKTLFAYGEGMMVPMGSFAGVSRPLVGVAVLDRSLREAEPGIYRTMADVRFGGHYRVPLRIGNPRMDTCLTVALPGPERRAPTLASVARFERSQMSANTGQAMAVNLAASGKGETILALATDTLGRWQKHFPLQRTGASQYAGQVSFPAPGPYRLIALDARASVSVKQETTP